MLKSIDEVIENFSLFDDWEERYRYLIDLGRELPHMDDALKIDAHLVKGCTSKVWLIPHIDKDGILHFEADSDAHIVRGLVALLMSVYQGRSLEELGNIDIESAFAQIGMDKHLSPNRRSGFFAMVEKLRAL